MYIPYSFMWEGTRYITLIGVVVDDYLELTEVKDYKNAMPWAILNKGNIKAMPNLKNQAGKDLSSVPIVNADSFEEKDGYYFISGQLNGEEVKLTDKALIVGGKVVCGEALDADTDVTPAPEETPTPAPEPEAEEEPVKEEVPEISEAPAEEAPVVEEEKPADPEPEAPPAHAPAVTEQEASDSFYGLKIGSATKVAEKQTILGAAVVDQSLQIGVELLTGPMTNPPHKRRREFQDVVQPAKQKARYPWQKSEDIDERNFARPEQPYTASGTPTVAPEPAPRPTEVDAAWGPSTPLNKREQWAAAEQLAPTVNDDPKNIAPEAPVQANPDVNKEIKEAFRSTLSPEVNKVIGDIPHSILGTIEAWTSSDIDRNLLQEQGEVYCIDHRWQKCGKWFCIDIVNHYVRYFYNMKLGVSIEIPIATCKDWLNIVSGNVQ